MVDKVRAKESKSRTSKKRSDTRHGEGGITFHSNEENSGRD